MISTLRSTSPQLSWFRSPSGGADRGRRCVPSPDENVTLQRSERCESAPPQHSGSGLSGADWPTAGCATTFWPQGRPPRAPATVPEYAPVGTLRSSASRVGHERPRGCDRPTQPLNRPTCGRIKTATSASVHMSRSALGTGVRFKGRSRRSTQCNEGTDRRVRPPEPPAIEPAFTCDAGVSRSGRRSFRADFQDDPARGAKTRLELVALDVLGLRLMLGDCAPTPRPPRPPSRSAMSFRDGRSWCRSPVLEDRGGLVGCGTVGDGSTWRCSDTGIGIAL